MKHIRKFQNAAAYSAATIYEPSVSLIADDYSVVYDPLVPEPPTPSEPDWVEIAGIKWAKWNVGATEETDYGLFFSWGGTQGYTASQVGVGEGKKSFNWANYEFSNGGEQASDMTKYNSTDGLVTLQPGDDAVAVAYGGNWRMPTSAETQALGNAVTTAWTSDYLNSGVAGLVCTDKDDSSKVLFFPAAGYAYEGSVIRVGSKAYYWGSSLNSSNVTNGRGPNLDNKYAGWATGNSRCQGFTIRGILDI